MQLFGILLSLGMCVLFFCTKGKIRRFVITPLIICACLWFIVHGITHKTLTTAAIQGDAEKVKALIASGANVNAVDENGMRVLHDVALSGAGNNAEITKILLGAGAKVDAVDNQGRQAIVFATEGQGVEMVKVLLATGAKANTVDNNGLQLIHLAAKTDSTDMIKVLLAAGAKVDALDKNGDQPLHWAARSGNPEMVATLLSAGAKVDAKDHEGDQPLHWAARYGNFGDSEMINELLAAGAKMDAPNKKGQSPYDVSKHIGPAETDTGNLKGSLDEATLNYWRYSLDPIFIKAKMCSVWNGRNGCLGKDIIFCSQSNSLTCNLYGITDENLIKEITQSMQNSGLRIKRVNFFRDTHDKSSVFDKPFYVFTGNAH